MTRGKLKKLLQEQAEVKLLADAQRRQHAIEYGILVEPRIEHSFITVAQKVSRAYRPKRRTAELPRAKRDLLFYHYGRYAAGKRDQQATEAHFGLLGME